MPSVYRSGAVGLSLDQTLIRKPYLEVAHFSAEKPGVRTKTWTTKEVVHVFLRRQTSSG